MGKNSVKTVFQKKSNRIMRAMFASRSESKVFRRRISKGSVSADKAR